MFNSSYADFPHLPTALNFGKLLLVTSKKASKVIASSLYKRIKIYNTY